MTPPDRARFEGSPISVDPLTSFGSREALIHDLEHALEPDSPHRVLSVFDLAGLDDYRRARGTIASDELTLSMARVFTGGLGDGARSYRPRQDEFCALVDGEIDEARPILDAVVASLGDEGATAGVSPLVGTAFLPNEAGDPIEALMIADHELAVGRRARDRRRPHRPPPILRLANSANDRER
jgi:GGDEF domain-containing protein